MAVMQLKRIPTAVKHQRRRRRTWLDPEDGGNATKKVANRRKTPKKKKKKKRKRKNDEEREGRTARMSDRPMRLNYLTKMKIILCIFLLCITAVSVFGEPQELNGIVGKSIEFKYAVKTHGNLIYSSKAKKVIHNGRMPSVRFTGQDNKKFIGRVVSGELLPLSNDPEYQARVQWDRSTGLFSLSGLRLEDSGVYTVQNTQQNISIVFQLNVYTMSESQELNGIVGQSVKFPAAVKTVGNLTHEGAIIGVVTSGSFTAAKFSGRLQWDCTEYFSLSGLKEEDSGEYEVLNTDQKIITVFQLNVYKDNVNVSKPNVSTTRDEFPCSILCSVERGTEVTLSWYREGEPYVTSPVESAPGLHLPKTVERSGTYTCEAKNSVSNEKASITVGAHCTGPAPGGPITAPSGPSAWTIVAIIFAVVAVFTTGFFAFKYHHTRSELKNIRRLNIDMESKDPVRDLISCPNALKTKTSSHSTEVPLNQATPEVEE